MLDYFQEEIFDQIPQNLHNPFLELAFLQEIPADLATEITGIENFSQVLFEMTQANFFIYSLDDKQHVFRFHHFFQESCIEGKPAILKQSLLGNTLQ